MKKERQSIFILLILSLTFSALVIHYNFQKVEINNDSSDAFNVDEGLTKPLIVSGAAHRLNAFDLDTMTITTLQRSHVRHGHAFSSPEEILDYSPFDTQLYIDGVEVDLYLSTEIDDSGEDPIYYYWYYYSFDAGYFTPGIYEWKVVWTDISGIINEITSPLTVLEEAP